MITDRGRFGAAWETGLLERIQAAAEAGVALIQIRERDMEAADLARLTRLAVTAVTGTRTRILVNDRTDVAVSAGAHGVHLRTDSVAASRVRGILPRPALLGRSVHSADEARGVTDAEALDYLICGTLFATPSKPGMTPLGVRALSAVVTATPIPVLAVGGVTVESVRDVRRAGAAGFAAIGLFAERRPEEIRQMMADVCAAFDTP